MRNEYLSAGEYLIAIQPGSNPKTVKTYLDILKNPNLYTSRFIVEQAIGQTDKNGVAIFDGDIVDILCEVDERGKIQWDDETSRFVVEADGFVADFDNYYGHDLEVIGNIHENSELLAARY